jgi:hypothetical protein
MDKITKYMKRLCSANDANWIVEGDELSMPTRKGERHQSIVFSRQGDDYVLTTVVLGAARVCRDDKRWRELARLAWRRNAENEIVTYAFDRWHRLVGQIRHPAEFLDYNELELYVRALARDCDRFEYLLTGRDVY